MGKNKSARGRQPIATALPAVDQVNAEMQQAQQVQPPAIPLTTLPYELVEETAKQIELEHSRRLHHLQAQHGQHALHLQMNGGTLPLPLSSPASTPLPPHPHQTMHFDRQYTNANVNVNHHPSSSSSSSTLPSLPPPHQGNLRQHKQVIPNLQHQQSSTALLHNQRPNQHYKVPTRMNHPAYSQNTPSSQAHVLGQLPTPHVPSHHLAQHTLPPRHAHALPLPPQLSAQPQYQDIPRQFVQPFGNPLSFSPTLPPLLQQSHSYIPEPIQLHNTEYPHSPALTDLNLHGQSMSPHFHQQPYHQQPHQHFPDMPPPITHQQSSMANMPTSNLLTPYQSMAVAHANSQQDMLPPQHFGTDRYGSSPQSVAAFPLPPPTERMHYQPCATGLLPTSANGVTIPICASVPPSQFVNNPLYTHPMMPAPAWAQLFPCGCKVCRECMSVIIRRSHNTTQGDSANDTRMFGCIACGRTAESMGPLHPIRLEHAPAAFGGWTSPISHGVHRRDGGSVTSSSSVGNAEMSPFQSARVRYAQDEEYAFSQTSQDIFYQGQDHSAASLEMSTSTSASASGSQQHSPTVSMTTTVSLSSPTQPMNSFTKMQHGDENVHMLGHVLAASTLADVREESTYIEYGDQRANDHEMVGTKTKRSASHCSGTRPPSANSTATLHSASLPRDVMQQDHQAAEECEGAGVEVINVPIRRRQRSMSHSGTFPYATSLELLQTPAAQIKSDMLDQAVEPAPLLENAKDRIEEKVDAAMVMTSTPTRPVDAVAQPAPPTANKKTRNKQVSSTPLPSAQAPPQSQQTKPAVPPAPSATSQNRTRQQSSSTASSNSLRFGQSQTLPRRYQSGIRMLPESLPRYSSSSANADTWWKDPITGERTGTVASNCEIDGRGTGDVPVSWPILKVYNLPFRTTIAELAAWLPKGTLCPSGQNPQSIHIQCDPETGRTLPIAFIECVDEDAAEKVAQGGNARIFHGHEVSFRKTTQRDLLLSLYPRLRSEPLPSSTLTRVVQSSTPSVNSGGPELFSETDKQILETLFAAVSSGTAAKPLWYTFPPERAFTRLIGLIVKFPWHTKYATLAQAERLYDLVLRALDIIPKRLSAMPLARDVCANLIQATQRFPGFSHQQKASIMEIWISIKPQLPDGSLSIAVVSQDVLTRNHDPSSSSSGHPQSHHRDCPSGYVHRPQPEFMPVEADSRQSNMARPLASSGSTNPDQMPPTQMRAAANQQSRRNSTSNSNRFANHSYLYSPDRKGVGKTERNYAPPTTTDNRPVVVTSSDSANFAPVPQTVTASQPLQNIPPTTRAQGKLYDPDSHTRQAARAVKKPHNARGQHREVPAAAPAAGTSPQTA